MSNTIRWSTSIIDKVIDEASHLGWDHHTTQLQQGGLVIFHRSDPSGENGELQKLNVWCTTGTVGSYLKHPNRKQPTQLFRREVDTWNELDSIFENPRTHTDKGYSHSDGQKKGKAKRRSGSMAGSTFGKISMWSYDMGYGFVTPENGGDDVFFHKFQLRRSKGYRLSRGDMVEFTVAECPKGYECKKVKVLMEEEE